MRDAREGGGGGGDGAPSGVSAKGWQPTCGSASRRPLVCIRCGGCSTAVLPPKHCSPGGGAVTRRAAAKSPEPEML